jgi:hypothetical protein
MFGRTLYKTIVPHYEFYFITMHVKILLSKDTLLISNTVLQGIITIYSTTNRKQ